MISITASWSRMSRLIKLGLLIFSLQVILCIYYTISKNNAILPLLYFSKNNTEYEMIKQYLSYASEGSWQNVTEITAFKFLVFSAFLDLRNRKNIKIIAVTKTKNVHLNLKCKLWFIDDSTFSIKLVEAKLNAIKEHWSLPYSAYYINCPLNEDVTSTPHSVSIVLETEAAADNLLKVIVNYKATTPWDITNLPIEMTKLAVCVKPFHYDYNQVLDLLEFIELHRILGVDHFYFYNHTVGPQVDCILNKYKNRGLITVLPWELPIVSQEQIRTEGIFASLNDCLFRTMHIYSHALFIDLDEYVIPTTKYSYRELIDSLDNPKYDLKTKSAFSFRNAFFYKQFPDDKDLPLLHDPFAERLLTLRKTRRRADLHPHRTRSKLIVRPEMVEMVGNHFIWDYYRRDYATLNVPDSDAILHHYRVCEFGGDDCVKQTSIDDRTAYRYKNQLINSVKDVYIKYQKECKLEEIN